MQVKDLKPRQGSVDIVLDITSIEPPRNSRNSASLEGLQMQKDGRNWRDKSHAME